MKKTLIATLIVIGFLLLPTVVFAWPSTWIGGVTQTCSSYNAGKYCLLDVGGGLEGGADVLQPVGMPITAVDAGTVIGAGPCTCGGWVISVRGWDPYFKHEEDIYYQHVDGSMVYVGEQIKIGQTLTHSLFGFVELGLNPRWWGLWGPCCWRPDGWINPLYSGWLSYARSVTDGSYYRDQALAAIKHALVQHFHELPYSIPTVTVWVKEPVQKAVEERHLPLDTVQGAATVTPAPHPLTIPEIIRSVFGKYSDRALAIAKCESGLNPRDVGQYGEYGIFQILPSTWQTTSEYREGDSPFNVWANTQAAYEIFQRDGDSFSEWTCNSKI